MTLLYTDELFLQHDTGDHPETADRLRAISARLHKARLIEQCQAGVYEPLMPEAVAQLHAPEQVRRVRQAAEQGGAMLDPDTLVSPASYRVALAAAGACAAAVDGVVTGGDRTALCLVRPPGHHATPSRSMGFCLFNNVALAAQHARSAHGLERLLIVDWDVHHGNGTQDVFYEDPQVMFFSAHRYPFYPGTGDTDETGTGPGLGFTLNLPLRYGITRSDYRAAFASALEQAARRIRPQLVLVSAGFDAHGRDPIGSLRLETEDFSWLTQQLLGVAQAHCAGRLVSCLEGGYSLSALAESVQAHLEELLAVPKGPGRDDFRPQAGSPH